VLTHGRWKDFFQGGSSGFFQVVAKSIFSGVANCGEISFYRLTNKPKQFFYKK